MYWVIPLHADGFVCAGFGEDTGPIPSPAAAKPVQHLHQGMRHALLLFAQFRDEEPGWSQIPAWSQDIFAPEKPGSFSHFYDTMSFGRLQIRGEVAPQWYAAAETKEAYIAGDLVESGGYGRFSLEVLRRADRDIDFSRFDDDGPDGIPNSGDDDGRVDALFLVLASTPAHFIIGRATGIAHLGFDGEFITGDLGVNGEPIRIDPRLGTLQQGRSFAETVGSLAHEYGHVLGLPDLYNVEFLRQQEAGPEEDSAGIGRWGLMGWGALGWNGDDGPTSFCAWSRMQLGWGDVREIEREREEMRLEEVGRRGNMFRIPLGPGEFFLLEHRLRSSSYYDRHIPGEGLLIWNIKEHASSRFAGQDAAVAIEGNASIQAAVFVVDDGRQYANMGRIEVSAFNVVEFRLSDRVALQGRVRDAAGNPLKNALVVLDHGLPAVMSLGETGFGVTGATHTDHNGDFYFEVPHGTYSIGVLPVGQLGIGRVVEDLVVDGAARVDLVLPEGRDLHRLQGRITDEPDLPRGRLVLQFFEEELGIVAQAVSGHDRGYHVELPGGSYRVRIGLEGPVGGILKRYDVGQVRVERDLWWNIDLSGTTTRVAETEEIRPEELSLMQNYPNPFNANTVIPYRLSDDAEVRLVIYDILGRRVKILVDEKQMAGQHQVVWSGADDGGRTVGSGVFFYRLFASDHMQTRRMLLLK